MSHHNNAPKLIRYDYGIIKLKVRQMIGHAGYTAQDRDDLEHELIARLIRSLESFDPAKGHRKAYVTACVEREVATMLRDKRAQKRDHRRSGSLHVVIEVAEDGPVELLDTITERELNAHRCRQPRSSEELSHLASDLAEARAMLPADEQVVFDLLGSHSITEIARMLRIPRTTLNDIVRRIRRRFENTGLRDYI